ncbi:hypothetical protein ACJX0J_015119 [Zea mays]
MDKYMLVCMVRLIILHFIQTQQRLINITIIDQDLQAMQEHMFIHIYYTHIEVTTLDYLHFDKEI